MIIRTWLAILLVATMTSTTYAESVATVTSTEGWSVTILIRYTGITRTSSNNNCRYGFNYNLDFDYEVSYSDGGGARGYYIGIGDGCVTNGGTVGIPENSALSGSIQSYGKYSNSTVNCNRVDPDDYFCETMNLTISAPGISQQTVAMQPMEDAVLPVFLSDFGADKEEIGVRLHWETQVQVDQDYFIVERSADGIHWEALSSVPGHTGFDLFQKYNFLDSHPGSAINYYRIVAIALDGSSTVSDVAAVDNRRHIMTVHPNPVTETLFLSGFDELRVFDMQGHEVTAELNAHRTGEEDYTIDVSGLKAGLYLARSSNGFRRFQRI
ncbi:MAG: T9SS type A sorting domain-containing protein [Lewinella sp.]